MPTPEPALRKFGANVLARREALDLAKEQLAETRLLITKKSLHIVLDKHDLGQLLDGLRVRLEDWSKMADYLESGYNPDEAFICEECSDPEEARHLARHYEKLISEIERQIEQQGGCQ